MNQYTDELILNSNRWIANASDSLLIKGMANFKVKPGITYSATYHAHVNGTPASAKIDLASFSNTPGATYRFWIELGERNSHTAEFQNSLTRENKVLAFEVASDTPTNMVAQFNKLINDYNRTTKNAKVVVNTSVATDAHITAVDEFVTIKKFELQELTPNTLTGYDHYTVAETAVITPGTASFGTAAWIVRNLRMPTLANTSWTAVMKDDGRPIPGESYDEFVITMTADRGELTGMGAVGQSLTSVTRHVFFVRSSIANTFKTDLESALGITVA